MGEQGVGDRVFSFRQINSRGKTLAGAVVEFELFKLHVATPLVVHNRRRPEIFVLQQRQGRCQNRPLPGRIIGRIQRIAVPEGHRQGPGRPNLFGCQTQQLDDDGRYALAFQLGCDQTHGLVAQRSDRDQKRSVDPIVD